MEYGQDWRLKVGDGQSSETFTTIGGEMTFDWENSSKEVDTSNKDDGIYGSSTYMSKTVTISVSGKLKLPDAGIQRLSDASKLSPPVADMKIVKGATTKFACMMAVGNFKLTAGHDDVVTWSCTLKNAAAPTVDDLGAA